MQTKTRRTQQGRLEAKRWRAEWWCGAHMTGNLLMSVACEEGWKPTAKCGPEDAAAFLNATGHWVIRERGARRAKRRS